MSELLAIGQQCSHPACSLVDFLPIKCQHCTKPFCSDHFKPDVHSCEKFDPAKHDRVAPACPFCQKPVAFAAGVDPNIAMENHFETSCEVIAGGGLVGMKSKAGRSGASASPRCARAKCNKVLVAPIRCTTCSQQFCAEHRFPANHKCITSTTGASTSASSSSRASPAPASIPAPSSSLADSAAARKNAALAAMNRAKASVVAAAKPTLSAAKASPAASAATSSSSKPATTTSSSNSSKPNAPIANPFSKTERLVLPPSTSSVKQGIDNARLIPERKSSSSSSTLTTSIITSSANTVSSSASTLSQPVSNITSPSNPASTTASPTPVVDKPRPIIPQSFVPRSIFGAA